MKQRISHITRQVKERCMALMGIALLFMMVIASYYYATLQEISGFHTPTGKETPLFISQNVEITEFLPSGSADVRYFAEHATYYEDGRLLTVKPRYATLSTLVPQTRASADKGETLDGGETALFTGHVVVTRAGTESKAPMLMKTEKMLVYKDLGRFETDQFIELHQGSDLTTGVGMTADNVDRTVEFFDQVHTVISPRAKR